MTLAWSPQAVHAQDSVENFIDLAPTDFGYIDHASGSAVTIDQRRMRPGDRSYSGSAVQKSICQ